MASRALSDSDIQFINQLACEAGEIAVKMREHVAVRTKSGPNDFVTDADTALSQLLIEQLGNRFPDDIIVSEEGCHDVDLGKSPITNRVWLIDPIDGTQNYIKRDGQYSVMIGLLVEELPYYGWMYQPSTQTLFAGGPHHGSYKEVAGRDKQNYKPLAPVQQRCPIRLMMGFGDRRRHPWVTELPNVAFVQSESLGLKIAKILENGADIFISLTGKVKLWDTAAPAAIALGAGLDAGTIEGQPLPYPLPRIQHGSSVIIGRPGSISWAAKHIHGHMAHQVPKASQ